MLKRNTPLRRKTPLRRSKKPIRSATPKRQAQLRRYYVIRKVYLDDNPICEVWLRENGWQKIGHHVYEKQDKARLLTRDAAGLIVIGAPEATEVHHTNKRRGTMLLEQSHWLAVCRTNHDRIENNKGWARTAGFLLNF